MVFSSPFFLLRIFIVTLFLAYASIHDMRRRSVPDKIWYIFGGTIPFILIYAYILEPSYLLRALPQIILVTGIGVALLILPLFGKMDSLGIIFIGIMLPEMVLLRIGQSSLFAPFAIVALLNGLLLSLLGGIDNLIKNLRWKLKYGSLYSNISSPKINKILYLFIARKVRILDLETDKFAIRIQEGNSLLRIRDMLAIGKDQSEYSSRRRNYDDQIQGVQKLSSDDNFVDLKKEDGTWVQRLLPFFPYLLLGLIAILVGEMVGILRILGV